tara:strand:- start:1530 stop:3041 length:1512 start_codon:yes stop_codon:yes gene_type:complete
MNDYHAVFVYTPFSKIDAMPLAPALLKAICDQHGLRTTTLDYNIELQIDYKDKPWGADLASYLMHFVEMPTEAYDWYWNWVETKAKELINLNCNWIGLSLLSYQSLCFTHDICYTIKRLKPNQKIIIGGSGISKDDNTRVPFKKSNKYMSDIMLETGLCDSIVINEGENVLIDILKNNKKGKFNAGKQLTHEELNELPTPSYIDYKTDLYKDNSKIFHLTEQAVAATITGSKGCVRRCTFCDVYSFEPKFVFKDGERIAEEMIEIYETQGITHFMMSDSLINGSMKAFRQMNTALAKKLPRTINYYGEYIARPEGQTTEEDYHLMAEAGCKHVIVGVESGSEAVRNHMKKKFTNDDLNIMIQSLHKVGITQEWNLMVGYLTETRKDFEETMSLVKRYKDIKFPNMIVNPTGILHIFPGSPLFDTHMRQLDIEFENIPEEAVGLKWDFWFTKQNPENTFENRVAWWNELIDFCYEHDYMTEYRYKTKKHLAKRCIEEYKKILSK